MNTKKTTEGSDATLQSKLCKISRLLTSMIRIFVGLLFSAAVLINFLNVAGRYAFSTPIYWAEEVTILLVACAVFLMCFNLTVNNDHLRTDLVSSFATKNIRTINEIAIYTISFAVLSFLAHNTYSVVSMMARFGQVTPVAEIPMFLIYGSVFIGFLLSAIASFTNLVISIKTLRLLGGGRND